MENVQSTATLSRAMPWASSESSRGSYWRRMVSSRRWRDSEVDTGDSLTALAQSAAARSSHVTRRALVRSRAQTSLPTGTRPSFMRTPWFAPATTATAQVVPLGQPLDGGVRVSRFFSRLGERGLEGLSRGRAGHLFQPHRLARQRGRVQVPIRDVHRRGGAGREGGEGVEVVAGELLFGGGGGRVDGGVDEAGGRVDGQVVWAPARARASPPG